MKRAVIHMSGNKTTDGLAEAIRDYLKANEHMESHTEATGDNGYTIPAMQTNCRKLLTGTDMAALVTLKPTGEGNTVQKANQRRGEVCGSI